MERSSAHGDAKQGRKQYGSIHDVDETYLTSFYPHVEEGTCAAVACATKTFCPLLEHLAAQTERRARERALLARPCHTELPH